MSEVDHAIKRSVGGSVPSLCVFLDTETQSIPSDKHGVVYETFRLAVAIKVQREGGKWGRRECKRFTSARDLWDWIHGLESFRRPVWVFAHNLGFDLTVSGFFDRLNAGQWSTRDLWPIRDLGDGSTTKKRKPWHGTLVLTDPPTILVLRSRKGSLRLVDTFNYYKGSIDQLGNAVGIDKLPWPGVEGSQKQWFEYCERDAEILERVVTRWIDRWEQLGCGSWRTTCAGLGYSAWRAELGNVKVIPDRSERGVELARDAYFGGQVEVYFRGNVQDVVYHVDVHSLYPSVMKSHKYPRRLIRITNAPTIEQFVSESRFFLPLAKVWIESEVDTYPVRRDGRYFHAVGRFWSTLAGDELINAVARGHVKRIASVAWYEPADLFTRFVDRWLALRHEYDDQGDLVGSELCKLVMNSVTGKLAQHKVCWVDRTDLAPLVHFGEWHTFHAQTGKKSRFRAIAQQVQEFTSQGESRESFCAVSAFITANGRERMRQLRSLAPDQSILYMDTDGMIVLEPAYRAFLDAGEVINRQLGKLRKVAEYSWIEIRGLKFYGNDEWVVCPGLKKDARVVRHGQWKQERFQRLSQKLLSYDGPHIAVNESVFTPVGSLGMRTATKSGWTKTPRLSEAEALPF